MAGTASDFNDSRLELEPDVDFDDRPRLTPPSAGLAIAYRLALLRAYLADTLTREMDARRGFLWLPVAFGTGVLGYFALPREPSVIALAALTIALALIAWRSRLRITALRILVVLTAIVAGATATKIRTDLVGTVMLDREVTATVVGWVSALEETPDGGRRICVRVDHIENVQHPPQTVRITIRTGATTLAVGDAISVLASLTPPSGPVEPGAYDFAEAAYYDGLGAYGFSFGAAKPAKLGPPPLDIRLAEPIAAMREAIRRRVESVLPGDNGHIAAALIMGDQYGVADQTQADMRNSGLGHVLSISGLHMALVAGFIFWLLRALMALSPGLALRRPIKKWAAGGALAVSAVYLAISGAGVATVRSFVMLAIMLGAILLERRALTLRNVALAALFVLIISPESVLNVSFQMSFAATAALVAAYEAFAARERRAIASVTNPLWERVKRNATGLILTSLVASLATAPFAVYHFQRLAPLTLVANVAAMPAIDLIVMPMALATALLMPFGLEVVPLAVMGWGLDWMKAVAEKTSEWSAGIGGAAMPSAASLLVAIAGFVWLILWRERWRFAGLAPIALALPLAALTPRPDVVINADGSAAAVREADGRLHVLGSDDFSVENWLHADGDLRLTDDSSLKAAVGCDRFGCVATLAGGDEVALVLKAEAFAEDCRRAAVVLSGLDAPKDCAARAITIDAPALASGGSHALFPDGDGYRYRMVASYPAERRPFMPPVPQ